MGEEMNMEEKIARAICQNELENIKTESGIVWTQEDVDMNYGQYIGFARAALSALKEPMDNFVATCATDDGDVINVSMCELGVYIKIGDAGFVLDDAPGGDAELFYEWLGKALGK